MNTFYAVHPSDDPTAPAVAIFDDRELAFQFAQQLVHSSGHFDGKFLVVEHSSYTAMSAFVEG